MANLSKEDAAGRLLDEIYGLPIETGYGFQEPSGLDEIKN